MPFVPVLEYQADWNSKLNKYRIIIKCQGNPQPIPAAITTEPEYISVLLMLSKAGVLYDPASGDFQLPHRPVGT